MIIVLFIIFIGMCIVASVLSSYEGEYWKKLLFKENCIIKDMSVEESRIHEYKIKFYANEFKRCVSMTRIWMCLTVVFIVGLYMLCVL